MNDTTTLRLRQFDNESVQALVEALRAGIGTDSIKTSVVKSFDGTPEILILISAATVALKHLAPIVKEWLNRYKGTKFKSKQFEATGYSADELLKIIREYHRNDD